MSKKEKESGLAVEEFDRDKQTTKRQTEIYGYIKEYIKKNGYSPILKEIAESCGSLSAAGVHNHINALIKKGLIKKTPYRTRALELIEKNKENKTDTVVIGINEEVFRTDKFELSVKSQKVAERLKQAVDSPDKGKIAAIDPESGEYYIGKSIIEAVKDGRKRKNDPKAVFYSVRIGFPFVHKVKEVNLKGYFISDIPFVDGLIYNRNLKLLTSDSHKPSTFTILADTGFSGSISLDQDIIQCIDADYLSDSPVEYGSGKCEDVKVYESDIFINDSQIKNVEVLDTGTSALGIQLMRVICNRVIFDFVSDKVLFED